VDASLLTISNPALPPPSNPILAVFFWVLLTPIAVGLDFLYHVFRGFGPTRLIGAFGLAVITLTLLLRGLLFPLFRYQIRTQRRLQKEQQRIAPQLNELRKKYKSDPRRQQQEIMAVYKEHGINPMGQLTGCLPLLLQMPIIYALYGSIHKLTTAHLPGLYFLWIANLTKTPFQSDLLHHPQLLIVPVLAGALTFVQTKMMVQPQRPDMSDQELQMYRVSSQMAYLMPVVIVVVALNFQQGVALYWVTQSLMMIVQQYFIVGWGQLRVPGWFPGAGRPPGDGLVPAVATAGAGPGSGLISQAQARARNAGGGDKRRAQPSLPAGRAPRPAPPAARPTPPTPTTGEGAPPAGSRRRRRGGRGR